MLNARSRRGYALAAALFVGGLVIGITTMAVSDDSRPTGEKTGYTPKPTGESSNLRALGGTASPDEAVRLSVEGLNDSALKSASLESSTQEGAPSGLWFSATVETDQSSSGGVYEAWLARLVQGAAADRLSTTPGEDLGQLIVGATIEVRDLSGATKLEPFDGMGNVQAGQVFSSEDATDEEIKDRVTQVLTDSGLIPVSISVKHALGAAVAVVARVPSDYKPGDLKYDNVRGKLMGSPQEYEGLYFEVQDPSGQPLIVSALATRVGGGASRTFGKESSDSLGHLTFGVPDRRE